jgi:hypothetical protein
LKRSIEENEVNGSRRGGVAPRCARVWRSETVLTNSGKTQTLLVSTIF